MLTVRILCYHLYTAPADAFHEVSKYCSTLQVHPILYII